MLGPQSCGVSPAGPELFALLEQLEPAGDRLKVLAPHMAQALCDRLPVAHLVDQTAAGRALLCPAQQLAHHVGRYVLAAPMPERPLYSLALEAIEARRKTERAAVDAGTKGTLL